MVPIFVYKSPTVPDDIMNTKAFECKNDGCETGPLNLRHCVVWHALLPKVFAIDAETFPCRGSPCPASSLLSLAPVQQQDQPKVKRVR